MDAGVESANEPVKELGVAIMEILQSSRGCRGIDVYQMRYPCIIVKIFPDIRLLGVGTSMACGSARQSLRLQMGSYLQQK